MNVYLQKIIVWATLINFSLIMPKAPSAFSDADCTSLKILRATSCVDALVSTGLLFADAAKAPHTLALARASALAALCHTTINDKKVEELPLRMRDWLTLGGCITKNILRASAPFIKNTSSRMTAYCATMLLELGAMGHAGYYLLDEKNDTQHYYLACLVALGLQAFIQGTALHMPPQPNSPSLLTGKIPTKKEQSPAFEKSVLEETDPGVLSTCSEKDFQKILYEDIKKAASLKSTKIDLSAFKDHSNCAICCDEDNRDNWIFTLNETHDKVASFCHVGCLARHFVRELETRREAIPQEQISPEEAAQRAEDINQHFLYTFRRQPTEQEFKQTMWELYESQEIPGKLPSNPFTNELFHETWKKYFITSTV